MQPKKKKINLSKGLDFALAPHVVPKRDIIVEIGEKLRHLHDSSGINLARSRIMTTLINAKSTPSNLNKHKQAALRYLKSDQSILILSADKGKGTVVIDEEAYFQRMDAIL